MRAEALALAFSRHLRSRLTVEQMAHVVTRNETYAWHTCASHDFCDANMVMLAAWKETQPQEIDLQSDADTLLWNQAWQIAKASEFNFKGDTPCVK